MDEELLRRWREYREAIAEAYRSDEGWVLNMANEAALERLAELSESLGGRFEDVVTAEQERRGLVDQPETGEGRLGRDADRERNELEEAAFAAATVDLTIGATVFREARPEWELGLPFSAEGLPPLSADDGLLPMDFLLSKADQAFGGSATVVGAQFVPESPLSMARATANQLVSRSREPVEGFTVSLFSLGMAGLIDQAGLLEAFRQLIDRAAGRLRPGGRLLRSAIKKLVGTMGTDGHLEEALEAMTESILGIRRFRFEAREERLIAKLVGKGRCLEDATRRFERRPPIRLLDQTVLRTEFDELCHRFSNRMWWAGVARGAMQGASIFVMFAAPGPGHLVMAGAYGVGLAVCLFALSDRLDTLPFGIGWVHGIPTIIENV